MARQAITPRALLTTGATLAAALLAMTLLRGPLGVLEDQVNAAHYDIRGSVQPDTNIVIVYIDETAIRALGWPLRRNFHALLFKALADLKVRAIGEELMFEEPREEYPEYDDLLARMLAAAPPTVLTCYFDTLLNNSTALLPRDSVLLGEIFFRYPGVDESPVHGKGLHPPLRLFRSGAAGLGHVNLLENGHVPLLVTAANAAVPAFSLELLRVASAADRAAVQTDGDDVALKEDGRKVHWRTSGGAVEVNYPGPLSAYTGYPFLDVLRAYDDARLDLPTSIPVARLRNKIVLIGVAAEGRGVVYHTPVDPRLPSIGLHAALLDNLLRSRFLVHCGWGTTLLVSAILGLLCAAGFVLLRGPWGIVVPAVSMLLLVVLSYMLFARFSLRLDVVSPVLTAVAAMAGAGLARHRAVRNEVQILSAEKEEVLHVLRDREARLAMLERQLLDAQTEPSADQTQALMEEIRKYKAEIRTLSSQADDMEESSPVTGEVSTATFEGIVYHPDGGMGGPIEFVKKIASSDAPVLILGESGTGKELIARAIHRHSTRGAEQFIAVNCGALSESLLESELFGHEKGAFTGAVKEKAGRFELADGGTIFLDEIGEVSEGFQLKLLRVLQEGELERVGGTTTLKVNVRVVAATNKNLKEHVRTKKFRDDLYYRLNVLSVSLPPLRERPEDIPLLVAYFLSREHNAPRVSRNVMEALREYAWPGNVRELESTIRRGALLAQAEQRTLMTVKDLPEEMAAAVAEKVPVHEQVLESIRELGFSRSAVTDTAAALGGMNRGTIAEYLRGESLKMFVDQQFDLDRAVKHLSLSTDAAVNARVRKRYVEYLSNIADGLETSQPWETARAVLKSKSKNLPQRYHVSLEQCAEAYYRGVWRLPAMPAGKS